MATDVIVPAAPSAAATTQPTTDPATTSAASTPAKVVIEPMQNWTRAQREEFRRTRKYPTKAAAPSTAPVTSKPAVEAKAETAAEKTDAKAEPSTAKPDETVAEKSESEAEKHSRRKPDAEHRIAELAGENKSLKARLDAIEKAQQSTQKAAPSTAAATETPKVEFAKPKPVRPNRDEFKGNGTLKYETPEAYDAALDVYSEALTDWKLEKRDWEAEQKRQADAFRQSYQETITAHPGSEAKITAAANSIFNDPSVDPMFRRVFDASPVFTELLYAVSEGDTLDKLIATAKTDPRKALSVLFVMEKDVADLVSKRRAGEAKPEKEISEKAEESEPSTKQKTEPTVKAVAAPVSAQTRVPPPPADVTGGHGVSTIDPMKAAVQSGNMSAVKRLLREKGIIRGKRKF